METEKKILNLTTKEDFSRHVIFLINEKDVDVLDGVEMACDHYNIEYENAKKFVNEQVLCLLKEEAIRKNLLVKEEKSILEKAANNELH